MCGRAAQPGRTNCGDGDEAAPNAELLVHESVCAQHGGQVEQRLTHAHEHHVAHALPAKCLRHRHHLGGQVGGWGGRVWKEACGWEGGRVRYVCMCMCMLCVCE